MRPLRGFAVLSGAVLLAGGLAAYSAAQTTPDQRAPAANYGPAMMNGWGGGYGPAMMNGWGGGYGPAMMNGWGGGYGPAMMSGWGGGYGPGPGMMNGWGGGNVRPGPGPGGPGTANVFDSLKQELNITAAQNAAWETYTTAVTTADHAMWSGMHALLQNGATAKAEPDAQFTLMRQMIDLRKQDFDAQQAAAKALLPSLSAYQSGQASEILPGLAERGRGFGRHGMWQWMMGAGGPPL